jgi:hypothetical protein
VAITVSQFLIRPARSAWSLETPPGALRGLTWIVSLPSPQSTSATALPLLTKTSSSPGPASKWSGPLTERIVS